MQVANSINQLGSANEHIASESLLTLGTIRLRSSPKKHSRGTFHATAYILKPNG